MQSAQPKNWLSIGHPDAGWRSAVIYSLLITALRYGLDPAEWLGGVLRRIPTCTPAKLVELLAAGGLGPHCASER